MYNKLHQTSSYCAQEAKPGVVGMTVLLCHAQGLIREDPGDRKSSGGFFTPTSRLDDSKSKTSNQYAGKVSYLCDLASSQHDDLRLVQGFKHKYPSKQAKTYITF